MFLYRSCIAHFCLKESELLKYSNLLKWKRVFVLQVTCQKLPLPEGVEVISANVSAGHLSSASIYPACLAPYLLVTACSDGSIR